MKIISEFVREQQRYTKNDIKRIFSFDESGVEPFIKNLKAYGILKSVKNTNDQLEMSDLVDDDVEITDVSAESGDCLYVFTYVGVITCGNRAIKVYPKYISAQSQPLDEMRQVVKVLERYNRSEKQIIKAFNGDGDNRTFNLLAMALYFLNDYYEYGIYTNTEDIVEINGEGDILWGKTIDESFVLIEDNRPYYMEMYTSKTVDDDLDYFRRLHEYVITDCSRQIKNAQLDYLFDVNIVEISDEDLEDFGDRDYILERIYKELNIQYNTRRQILLKTMYAYIAQNRKIIDDNDGISMFGTNSFHVIWEKVCSDVFDNQLGISLGKLKMTVELSESYAKDKNKALIEIIEKPQWEGSDTVQYASETLIPDLISIYSKDAKDYFIIFDAKYYNLQLEKGKQLRGNPGVGDVTKQYLYQLAYKKFIEAHNFAVIKNCFLMPTESDVIINKGIAKMSMLEALGLKNIQIRQMPAKMMFQYYLEQRTIDIDELDL